MNTRSPAVAGQFYDGRQSSLATQLHDWLDINLEIDEPIKAIIVPHAGYPFSGETAAQAYALVKKQAARFRKVIVVGPSHHYFFHGVAIPECDYFQTPLGNVALDRVKIDTIKDDPMVKLSDDLHRPEHSIEVQLPFIQSVLQKPFQIIPMLVSDIDPATLKSIIESLWSEDTLLVISSDLSHYHPYDIANKLDDITCNKINNYQPTLESKEACGNVGINALLLLSHYYHYHIHKLCHTNSGDSTGSKSRVVGYASYVISSVQ